MESSCKLRQNRPNIFLHNIRWLCQRSGYLVTLVEAFSTSEFRDHFKMALRIVEIVEVMEELAIKKKKKIQEFTSLFLFWSQQLKSKGNCRTQWKWKLHCKKILTGAMRGRGGLSALQVDLKSKTQFKVKLDHWTCRWRRSKTEWGKLNFRWQFYNSTIHD